MNISKEQKLQLVTKLIPSALQISVQQGGGCHVNTVVNKAFFILDEILKQIENEEKE